MGIANWVRHNQVSWSCLEWNGQTLELVHALIPMLHVNVLLCSDFNILIKLPLQLCGLVSSKFRDLAIHRVYIHGLQEGGFTINCGALLCGP